MMVFLPGNASADTGGKLDWFGFGTLSLAVGALQLMLDRGEHQGLVQLRRDRHRGDCRGCRAFYLFLVHTFTADTALRATGAVPRSQLCDRHCVHGRGRPHPLRLDGAAALVSARAHGLSGLDRGDGHGAARRRHHGRHAGCRTIGGTDRYPCAARRGPRRHGVVVLCDDWVDAGCLAGNVCRHRLIQGAGLGFLFVPLSAVTLSTLAPEHRTEGASFYNLSRNIGSSAGISIVSALLTHNTQINHAAIAEHVTAVNRAFEDPAVAHFWNPMTAAGRAALDAMVTRQAQIIAYIDDYKLLMIATLAVIPLLLVFKSPSGRRATQPIAVAE